MASCPVALAVAPFFDIPQDAEPRRVGPAVPGRWPRLARTFLKAVSWLVALLSVAAVVDVAVTAHASPGVSLAPFGHPVLSVVSGSMTPTIRTGDLIVDDPVPVGRAAHLKVGEIISFTVASGPDRRIFTHRIVAVNTGPHGRTTYTTKGDANNAPDAAPVVPGAVIGTYGWRIPDAGYVLGAIRRPIVIALLVLWASIAFLLVGRARPRARPSPGLLPTTPGPGRARPNR
jgi:signal peptidase